MDLGTATADLEALHGQLADIFATYGNPQPFSLVPDNMRVARDTLDAMPEHLERLLAAFHEAARAEAYGEEDPGILNPYPIADGSPLARFATSTEPLTAKLETLANEFRSELDQATQTLDAMLTAHRQDMERIVNTQNAAREGNYGAAAKIIEDCHRLFKGTNYYQAEQKVASMSKQISIARQGIASLPAQFQKGLEEADAVRVPVQRTKLLKELRAQAVEAERLLEQPRKNATGTLEDSQYATELAELEAQFAAWQEQTLTDIDARIRRSTSSTWRIAIISTISLIVLVVAVTTLVLWMTGYRIVGPDGTEISKRFVLPGTHEVTFTREGYKPYVAAIPVSLAGVTDLGQVTEAQMTRTMGSLDLKTDPSPVAYTLQGHDRTAGESRDGMSPATLTDLPTGPYTLTLTLGDFTDTREVEIKDGETLKVEPVLDTGVVKLSSTPLGATVYRDGQAIGKTPLDLVGWKPGDYTLELESQGVRQAVPLTVAGGKTETSKFVFPRGGLTLQSDPSGAQVSFPGSPLKPGTTPYTAADILAGTYQAELKFPGLEPVAREVDVQPGDPTTVRLVIPHGKAVIRSEPPNGVLISFPGSTIEQTRAPANLPVLPPGDYTAEARTVGGAKQEKAFTVKEGQTTEVTFTFPRGELVAESLPAGAKFAIVGLPSVRGTTPGKMESVLAGTYEVDFYLNNVQLRRTVTIPPNGSASVRAQFLEAYLLANKDKYPVSSSSSFNEERELVEGIGTAHAKLGGSVAEPLRKFGLPDRIKRLPDEKYGSKYIITWEKTGFSLSTDGDRILSLTYTAVEPVSANSVYLSPYWTTTTKGITIGSTAEQVTAKYGPPQTSPHGKGAEYNGITFVIAPRGDANLVTSMRIDAPAEPEGKKAP